MSLISIKIFIISVSFLDVKKLFTSFHYAFRGIYRAFLREQNFRIGIFFSLIIIFLMLYYKVAIWEKVILILTIITGLVLELFNTILEKVVNILKPRIHPYAEVIKDMMAGTVLLAFLGGTVIAVLIFLPYILR